MAYMGPAMLKLPSNFVPYVPKLVPGKLFQVTMKHSARF